MMVHKAPKYSKQMSKKPDSESMMGRSLADLSPLSNIIGDDKPSPIKSDSNPASSNAVDDGLHLSKHLYFRKDPGKSPHKPSSGKDKSVVGCAYLPKSPTVYTVISDPMIVENSDILSTSRTCTPPALPRRRQSQRQHNFTGDKNTQALMERTKHHLVMLIGITTEKLFGISWIVGEANSLINIFYQKRFFKYRDGSS